MTNNEQGKFGIYISNLHSSIDDQTLSDTLSQFGEILSCKVSEKGSGNVFFGSDEAAKTAVEKVNGMMLQGQQVTVVRTDGEFTEVFIKNIKLDITDEELKTFIKKNIEIDGGVDPIKGVNIFRDKENIWATVSFINHETAVNVVSKLNGKNDPEIQKDETPLYIARYIQRQPKAKPKTFSPTSLYVKNLDDSITDQLLKDAFSRFGEVTSAKVMMDDKTPPLPKGFGFVDFKEVDSAYKALAEMNGYLLGSKPLYVNIAQPKEVRRAALEAQYASRSGPRGVPAQIPGYLPGYPPPFFGGPAPGYFNVPGRAMLPPKGWPTGPGGFPGAQFQGPPGGARGRGRGYY